MAGNPKTAKTTPLPWAEKSKSTGVKTKTNNKNVPERSTSTAQKMKYGGMTKKKK
jgi:hypothetical protein